MFRLFRWQDLLNADLVDQMTAPDILEMRALLLVVKIRADAGSHRQNNGLITHRHPIVPSYQPVVLIACKGVVGLCCKVRFVEVWQMRSSYSGKPS